MKKLICGVCFLSVLMLAGFAGAATTCCTAPDSNFPPPCPYDHNEPVMIIDGLSLGTIEIYGPLQEFSGITRTPGGPLGGEVENFSSQLVMQMRGTGEMAGFNRMLVLQPVQCQTHIGPRNPGDPVQSFPTDMFMLQGQITGDPDFDLLRITAGTAFGMPSPGHTTLTRLPDGNWNVDSFFDITYRIDFVGAPTSALLHDKSGSTTGTIRFETPTCQGGTPGGGDDCYDVSCGATQFDFNSTPIPADFFAPGSDPFDGVIMLGGGDPMGPDTIVHRTRSFLLDGPPETVPIELVQLSLVSCAPITVTYNGGQNPEPWNVSVGLSQLLPSTGQMTATKTHANGGTFEAQLYVQPVFTFTRECPYGYLTQEGPQLTLSTVQPYNWQDTSPKPNPPCDGNGFYVCSTCGVNFVPGVQDAISVATAPGDANNVILELRPPCPSRPYVVIDTKKQWQDALQMGTVASVNDADWLAYMGQWRTYLQQGTEPYPTNQYFQPTLYAWDPLECTYGQYYCRTNPAWPDSAGMVMAWHDEQTPDGSYSAAWKYTYPTDPDLTGVLITVTVNPPCAGITTVSLGLKDIFGNIRAWHWNVPGTLPCGVPTAITIDTSVAGPAAGTPVADGYMSNPAFDITQVAELLFDENCSWVASAGVPPPGEMIPRAWNYWYDLLITPKPPAKEDIGPLKWSQPPVEISRRIFLGWDEKSVRDYQPLLADDWACKDPRPVTDIHWWGSFLNWIEPNRPPQMPTAFHIGIWTDVPKNPNDLKSFSHPGELVWQYICEDYRWNFAGYDKDPRRTDNPASANAVTSTAAFDPAVKDSCFQFNCDLPETAWFHQKPTTFNQPNIYWLSIAAIYPAGTTTYFPWGWKTRPRFFNDDAVRIFQLQDGSWPPNVGAKWQSGEPVEFPQRISWDLAFELTTNRPDSNVPVPDLNTDGIVNFIDLAYFADHWLAVWP